MNNKIKFLRGTSGEYTVAEKDNDTIYFTTDDGKLYIGDNEISGGGSYELPIATTSALGGVMVDGSTITIDSNGKISASGGGAKLLVDGRGWSFTFTGSYNLFYYIIIFTTPSDIVTNSSGIVENNSTTKLGRVNNADFNMTISSNRITFSDNVDVRMKLYGI